MAQQVHQGVNADVGVGQFGGEGVAKAVQQGTFGARSPSMPALPERAQYAILQGAAGDALAVAADEQRRAGGQPASPPVGEERRVVVGNRIFRLSR